MGDIVATIQAEQDRVIRSDLAGVLVVQGGPGTGKTAVALHRAAYLLYTHRERLARSGVLVVGPNPVFLRYIEQVLPSLGETGVRACPRRPALPRRRRDGAEPRARSPRSRATCGWRRSWRRAVRDRQRVPRRRASSASTAPAIVAAPADGRRRAGPGPAQPQAAQPGARRVRQRHARRTWPASWRGPIGTDARRRQPRRAARGPARLPRRAARAQPGLDAADARSGCSPTCSPTPARLGRRGAVPDRRPSARCCAATRRAPWTVADVPLLDEAAELLGEDDTARPRRRSGAAGRAAGRGSAYARGVLEIVRHAAACRSPPRSWPSGSPTSGPRADGGRTRRPRPHLDLRPRRRRRGAGALADDVAAADPALPDPVDDVVGDLAQTGVAGRRALVGARCSTRTSPGAGGWSELTVNYRTPARSWRSPRACSPRPASPAPAPESVREGDWQPVALRVAPRRLPRRRGRRASAPSSSASASGRLAVVAPAAPRDALRAALVAALPAGHGRRRRGTPRPPGRRCWPCARPRAWSSTRSSLVEPADDRRRVPARRQRPVRRADPADPAARGCCTPSRCRSA